MLDRLLPEDFEQRNAASPGVPVPRAEWLQANELKANELKAPGRALISELAVHDRGELAIASFRLTLAERELFVVDVWRRSPTPVSDGAPGRGFTRPGFGVRSPATPRLRRGRRCQNWPHRRGACCAAA
jgi:hypothetical protein